jgi:hypothetical protein
MTPELDLLMRLKVVEGALGLVEGSLLDPKDIEHGTIRPEWFVKSGTGFYNLLVANVNRTLRGIDSASMDAEDIVLQAFYGMNTSHIKNNGKVLKNAFYQAGVYLSEKILKGEIQPLRVASGPLGKMLFNRALSVIRSAKKLSLGLDVNPEGEQKDIPDTRETPHYVCSLLMDNNELGQEIRDYIQKSILNINHDHKGMSWIPHTGKVMLKAFSGEYGGTPFIPKASVAHKLFLEEFNTSMSLGNFHTKPFQRFWVLLAKALEENPALSSKIQTAMLAEGIEIQDFDPEKWFGGGGQVKKEGGKKAKRRKNCWTVWHGDENPEQAWRSKSFAQITGHTIQK